MSMKDDSLKNYLYRLRMYRGYSQKQLAGLLGLPARVVSDLEKGRRLPRLRVAMQLEVALGTKLSEMYPGLYHALGLELVARERRLPTRFTRHILGRVLRKDADDPAGSGRRHAQEFPAQNPPSVRGVQRCLPF